MHAFVLDAFTLWRRSVSLIAIINVCVHVTAQHTSTSPVLVICNRSSHISYGGPGEQGIIILPRTFATVREPCSLNITACSRCRIRLNITDLWTSTPVSFLDSSDVHRSSVPECNYLYLFEPGYPNQYFYITPSNVVTGNVIDTQTRSLTMRYCNRAVTDTTKTEYRIDYEIIEKNTVFHGEAPDSGFLTSLGFPNSYGPNGDVFVYHFQNDDPDGFIRLSFDDWNLSPQCLVNIIMDNKVAFSSRGIHQRPFIVSDGPNMTLEFWTSTNVERYTGFKAAYQFVLTKDWPEKPKIVDEFYYGSNLGGQLTCDCRKYGMDGWADIVWVIPRSTLVASSNSSTLMLRLVQNTLLAGDSLEIRSGNSSDASLVTWNSYSSSRTREYFNPSGFYVRLRMLCNVYRRFEAVFAWVEQAGDKLPRCSGSYGFSCYHSRYCLSQSMVCDGIAHCYDGSDELNCPSQVTITSERPPRDCNNQFFKCHDGLKTVCKSQQCNQFRDCADYSDEFDCNPYSGKPIADDPLHRYSVMSKLIPAVLGVVISVVIFSGVAGFMIQRYRNRHKISYARRMARLRLTQHPPAVDEPISAGDLPPAFSDTDGECAEPHHYLMRSENAVFDPPPYDSIVALDSVRFVTSTGTLTFLPPPYSDKSTDLETNTGPSTTLPSRDHPRDGTQFSVVQLPGFEDNLSSPDCSARNTDLMSMESVETVLTPDSDVEPVQHRPGGGGPA